MSSLSENIDKLTAACSLPGRLLQIALKDSADSIPRVGFGENIGALDVQQDDGIMGAFQLERICTTPCLMLDEMLSFRVDYAMAVMFVFASKIVYSREWRGG